MRRQGQTKEKLDSTENDPDMMGFSLYNRFCLQVSGYQNNNMGNDSCMNVEDTERFDNEVIFNNSIPENK
jgi:hypothetical protein